MSFWAQLKRRKVVQVAAVYGRVGDAAGAMAQLERLRELASRLKVDDTSWALAALGVGDEQGALEHIEAAARSEYRELASEDTIVVPNLTGDPVLDQPEFVAVRRQLQLE